ncbi:MAG: outer membrane lipoprotein carrier protein LolA [Candidatus Obscuribacterales bacterium]
MRSIILACLVVPAVWMICTIAPGQASINIPPTSMLQGKPNSTEGKAFLKDILNKIRSFKEYSFESQLVAYKKSKPVTEKGRFYFKAPNLVRFEVTDAGKRSGSVVVRQKDGKIRAKSGGLFSGLTISVAPNSKLLRTANGFNILESDLGSLLSQTISRLDSHHTCLASNSPLPYPGRGSSYVVEVIGDDNLVDQRIVLDKKSRLPVEWALFEGDQLLSVVNFQNLEIDADIEDTLFSLDVDQLASASKGFNGGSSKLMDRLATGFNGPDARLSVDLMRDVRAAVVEIKINARSLAQDSMNIIETKEEGTGAAVWAKTGRQSILVRAASIEIFEEYLEKAGELFRKQLPEGNSKLINAWSNSVSVIDRDVSQLYDLMQADRPATTSIMGRAGEIQNECGKLEVLCQEALFLVD